MGKKYSRESPPIDTKDLKKKMTRTIDKMCREFGRDKNRLKIDNKRIMKDLEKMVKNNESKSSQKLIAHNLLKNQNFLTKYDGMEAKMKAVRMQIQQVATTEAMINVMKGLSGILGNNMANFDLSTMTSALQDFQIKMEEQEGMNDLMRDALLEEDEIEDDDVNDLLDNIENKVNGKGGGTKQIDEIKQTDDFSTILNDLKK